jgi:hypothetical protein
MAESMGSAGEWGSIRRPSETEIVELFIGKTMWHSHFRRIFPRVPNYPDMLKWLREDDDAPASIDIWGEERTSVALKELREWMDSEDRKFSDKGKGKAKVEYKKGKKGGRKDSEDSEDTKVKYRKGKKGKRVDTEDSEDSEDSDSDKKKKKKKKKSKGREEVPSNKHHTRSKGKAK